MAAGTLALEYVYLKDNFPWAYDFKRDFPKDGFSSTDHISTTAQFEVGTKFVVWDAVSKGWTTFIYLQMDAVLGATIGKLCSTVANPLTVAIDPYNVVTSSILGGCAAVATGTIALSAYGFFWCGGPCPQETDKYGCVGLSAVTVVTSDIAAGMAFELADNTSSLKIQGLATAGAQCAGYTNLIDT